MRKPKQLVPFIMLDDKNHGSPLYRQIYEAIRRAILSGEFSVRMRLPASRVLAQQLGVSRITVVNAYEQLFAEGYLEGKIGDGTFVAAQLPDDLLHIEKRKITAANKSENHLPLRLSPFGERLQSNVKSIRTQTSAIFQPFQNGLTAVDKFPFEIWSRIAARLNRNLPREILGYGEPQGYLPLREAVAAHLTSARGVSCTPAQVIITSGAQQALDLTARIILSEKDSVWIEDPCYQEAKSVFAATGAKVVSVPVDEEGFNLSATPKRGAEKAKLIYVTPSHQYPLGVTMSLPRRLALIEWAKRNDAWIIEDDYNSEFRYAGRPLASLQGLDRDGRVIYMGTFSKTIFPSLRIGCLVVPSDLVDIFTVARALNDVHSSLIEQAILTEFIAEGHFARHIRRMRTLYEERQKILIEECEKHLGDLLEVKKADAGMHLVGWLPEGVSGVNINRRAAKQNLKLAPISSYSSANELPRDGLILGYTAFDKRQIRNAVRKLKAILVEEISK